MRSGDLRQRVTFQTRTNAQDPATGVITESWANAFTVWASVATISGRELLSAQQLQSEVTHTVMVRYRTELANPQTVAAMRIVFGTRYFNILDSANENERNREVILQVQEGLTKN